MNATAFRARAIRLGGMALRYGVSGVFASLIYFASASALVEWAGAPPVLAAALATTVVIVTSYLVNRYWVFSSTRSHASSFTRFVLASGLSMGLNSALMWLAAVQLGWSYIAGLLLATLVVPPVNFVVNYLWCFRPALSRAEGRPS